MNRVILDTNILISALLNHESSAGFVYHYVIQNHELLYSEEVFDEYFKTFCKQKFRKYFTLEEGGDALALIREVGKPVKITSKIKACRDTKDNKFLELAVDGKAHFIISGDDDLLDLHPFKGIKILTTKDFLKLL